MCKIQSFTCTGAAANLASNGSCHPVSSRTRIGRAALLLGFAAFAVLLPQPDLWAADSPAGCPVNYSVQQSITLIDWEAGLDSWTPGTYQVAKPSTFDTPDWAAVGGLPDGRSGMAAFVENINEGNCASDDESGVLTLTSPVIAIPGDAVGPRIALNHWFDIEHGWDGGNLKISVNGGDFTLVPGSAFEIGPYTDVLEPSDFGTWNTNPLADQEAFTGPGLQGSGGIWDVSRVTLAGIAGPGDSIQLRFDFGVDGCDGTIGWYVDEVEVYSCAPSPPGLTIVKQVVNDDGGTATVDDFSIMTSAGTLVFDGGTTVGDTTTYTAAQLTDLTAGVPYTLAEADVAGYSEGSWSCIPDVGGGAFDSGSVTLPPNQAVTCTIVNNDIAPSLTIVKQVVNNDVGAATVADFNIASSAGTPVFDGGSTVGDTTIYTAAPLTGLTVGEPYSLAEADLADYIEGTWNCAPNAGGGAFDNGEVTLSLGESATCTISNDDNPIANLSITKTDRRTTATPGGTTTYSIVVRNSGPSTVSDAAVTDNFPAVLNCSYTSVAAGGASGNTAAGAGNIADTLVLPPGSSVTYTAPCNIYSYATETLTNTAMVSSAIPDWAPGNESATDTTDLVPSADLSITKTDGQAFVTPGGNTSYTIVVSNAGPSQVNDALVIDDFPAELGCSYSSEAIGGASGNTVAGAGNIADPLVLPPGSSVTYTAVCEISLTASGTLTNTASVSSSVADPTPGNDSATDTSQLIASADLSITKTDGLTAASPGGSTTYTIVVSNAGPSQVNDALVIDDFPAELGCSYSSEAIGGASGNTVAGAGDIADTLVLPVGASVTYTVPCTIDLDATDTLTNIAVVSSAIADPNPGNNSASDFTNLTASADLTISKTDDKQVASPGTTTTYTIVVSNAGPSNVTDALVTDSFPAELSCSYTSVTAGGASGNTAAGTGDIADTLVLPVGGSVTYTVPCDIDPAASGTLANTANVSSVVTETNPGNESATDTTNLTASADLSISKSDDRTSVTPGGSTIYTVYVSNNGPSSVSDALVTDTFPTDLDCTFTSVAAGGASGNTAAGAGDIADTLVLPVGGSVTYTVPCDIDAGATGTLDNTASVSSAVNDPTPGNDSATDSNTLVASADLSITKSDGQETVAPGESTTYTIMVSNAGPSDVSDALVTDTFPAELSCDYSSVAAGGASGNTAAGAGDIDDTLVLPVGGSVTYTVPCEIDAGATGTLDNTASVSSAVNDPAPGNDSATDSNTLVASADLSITKSDGQETVTAGESTTYTIVVSNAGPSDVSDAQVTDTFPAELSCDYSSVAAGDATGNTASGSGNIDDTLVLPVGGSVTYTVPCDLDPDALEGTLSNTASIHSAVGDPNPGDESATDETSIVSKIIFSDSFEP